MPNLSKLILKIAGWTTVTTVAEPPQSIVCVAPHTSNWDYILGQLYYWSENRTAHFLIKKSWFKFPFGTLFRKLGGVPVDRSRNTSTVEQMIAEFKRRPAFHLAITPEGTRKRVKKWKMGFYNIALAAKAPIQLAYIDYKKKEIGITKIIVPSGNVQADMNEIYKYFEKRTALHPKNFYVPPIN
ncbi:MAG: lysophospholipid acyltransferase family protein [Prevotellaceae bacterium]|jgi:1-acyl-sn-glycerol-3-phosphate acyltransferase|nr:lysophospholipid acyltransferase family protein [Prevotellaceae bacterium]